MKKLIIIFSLYLLALASNFSGITTANEVLAAAEKEASNAAVFDPNTLFPSWGSDKEEAGRKSVDGIIGVNSLETTGKENKEGQVILYFIPKIIDFLLILVAPLIFVFLIYSGFLLITAGSDEESATKAKDYIKFCLMGLMIILLSYSLIKTLYLLLL